MRILIIISIVFLLAGCSKQTSNPDVRPLLDELTADSRYETTLQKMRGHFSVKGITYWREQDYYPAPNKSFRFYWSPKASNNEKYKSVIRLKADGYAWKYYVEIFFDSDGLILGVSYRHFTPEWPPIEKAHEWTPKW